MSNMTGITWITWENHRRTAELSDALKANLVVIESTDRFIIGHIIRAIKTVSAIRRAKNHTIIVQNPSRILAALAAMLKIYWKFPLVVDRHTNFRLGRGITFNPLTWFVILCSNFSLRIADLTIVTNRYLASLVEKKGGRAFVLTDRIPNMGSPEARGNPAYDVIFVSTFASDEPYKEVIEAGALLPKDIKIAITGNYKKVSDLGAIPDNVALTGFVSDSEYASLMHNAKAVMVFTTADWCLVCGGYEAMALGKPLITSDTQALQEFYSDSALYIEHSPGAIAAAIEQALAMENELATRMSDTCETKRVEWNARFDELLGLMNRIEAVQRAA